MGIKILVNSKGLQQVQTNGTGTIFEMPGVTEVLGPLSPPAVASLNTGVTAGSTEYILLEGVTGPVTGSLPAITSDLLGRKFVFMNASATEDMVLSGTNNIGGTTWERAFATAFSSVTVMAVDASTGYYWHVISFV